MQLQASQIKESDALKELRKALKSGDTTAVVSSHSDERLIQLLRSYQLPARLIVWWSGFSLLFMLGYFVGAAFHLWKVGQAPVLINAPTVLYYYFFQTKPEAWVPVAKRIEAASLPTLLDAYSLRISALSMAIREGMIKRLTRATADDLEQLTLFQRKQLVRFTLAQLQSQRASYHMVLEGEAQAATLGYLALATLKQSGAENPNRHGMNSNHTNLRKAIGEYLDALRYN